MSGDVHLTVVVPAFQAGASVALVIEEILKVAAAMEVSHEVVVISDGSTDDTVERVQALADRGASIIHYEVNRGKGYALRTGFAAARGDVIAYIDADLDLHPRGIAALYQVMQEQHADVVVGSKLHPGSKVSYPWFRRFQSRIFRRLIRTLFGLDVADTQTGLKIIRKECLDSVLPLATVEGFAFDLELLVLLCDAGYRVLEGPIELDFQFRSTVGPRAVFDMLGDVRAIHRRRRERLRKPAPASESAVVARSEG